MKCGLTILWVFLRLGVKKGKAEEAIEKLKGRLYNLDEIDAAFKLVEQERILETNFSYSAIVRENCSEDEFKLDIVFKIFSIKISPFTSSTFEFHQAEKKDPGEGRWLRTAKRKISFVPKAGYDGSNQIFGGGEADVKLQGNGTPLEGISIAGVGG